MPRPGTSTLAATVILFAAGTAWALPPVLSGAAPVRGRAAIRAVVDKMIQSGVKVHIDTARAQEAGELAYFYGPYSVSSKQGVVERGTYLEIWRRHGDQWHIELDVNATGAPIIPTH